MKYALDMSLKSYATNGSNATVKINNAFPDTSKNPVIKEKSSGKIFQLLQSTDTLDELYASNQRRTESDKYSINLTKLTMPAK